jgi:hypothetical protein
MRDIIMNLQQSVTNSFSKARMKALLARFGMEQSENKNRVIQFTVNITRFSLSQSI